MHSKQVPAEWLCKSESSCFSCKGSSQVAVLVAVIAAQLQKCKNAQLKKDQKWGAGGQLILLLGLIFDNCLMVQKGSSQVAVLLLEAIWGAFGISV